MVCGALIESATTLEVVFLHIEPRTILAPVDSFLESFDVSASGFGSSISYFNDQ
jgi:hypothetical protein